MYLTVYSLRASLRLLNWVGFGDCLCRCSNFLIVCSSSCCQASFFLFFGTCEWDNTPPKLSFCTVPQYKWGCLWRNIGVQIKFELCCDKSSAFITPIWKRFLTRFVSFFSHWFYNGTYYLWECILSGKLFVVVLLNPWTPLGLMMVCANVF